MRITRLHIILAVMLVIIAGVYVIQVQQKRVLELERIEQLKALDQKRAEEDRQLKLAAEQKKKECQAKKKDLAVQAVAVAGEYWMITKKENKDLSPGQATLKSAKEALAADDFEKSWRLARQSIDEFKAAPVLKHKKIFYKVRVGDCLWRIAKMPRHYGRGSMWVRIWRANKSKIRKPSLIFPRQVFYIPK
jgi:nucleoid-associated protein YgaU